MSYSQSDEVQRHNGGENGDKVQKSEEKTVLSWDNIHVPKEVTDKVSMYELYACHASTPGSGWNKIGNGNVFQICVFHHDLNLDYSYCVLLSVTLNCMRAYIFVLLTSGVVCFQLRFAQGQITKNLDLRGIKISEKSKLLVTFPAEHFKQNRKQSKLSVHFAVCFLFSSGIKALRLPMACTMTQFSSNNTYFFAVRAKDSEGRVGPFSNVCCSGKGN